MSKARKCALSARLVRPVKAAANGANAGAKAAVNEVSAVRAKSPIPHRLKRPWAQTRQQRPTRPQRSVDQPKTVNAVNVAHVTATAVTAASALVKHVRTLQASKLQAMTAQSQAV
jgi:hypothetical protein